MNIYCKLLLIFFQIYATNAFRDLLWEKCKHETQEIHKFFQTLRIKEITFHMPRLNNFVCLYDIKEIQDACDYSYEIVNEDQKSNPTVANFYSCVKRICIEVCQNQKNCLDCQNSEDCYSVIKEITFIQGMNQDIADCEKLIDKNECQEQETQMAQYYCYQSQRAKCFIYSSRKNYPIEDPCSQNPV